MANTGDAPQPTPHHRLGRRGLNLATSSAREEIGRRAPWMAVSIVAGIAIIVIGQSFEEALARKIQLVFFLPTIVYMSDIIGTETLALVVRELAVRTVHPLILFRRELLVGLALGTITGVPMGLIAYVLLRDPGLALTVGIAMSANGLVAVLLGLFVPIAFARLRRDPAIGSDEIMTALSDTISMTIYLLVASVVLFS